MRGGRKTVKQGNKRSGGEANRDFQNKLEESTICPLAGKARYTILCLLEANCFKSRGSFGANL